MEVCWQDKNIFGELESNKLIDINEIEAYIYSIDYIKAQSPVECADIKNIYNPARSLYFFEVEKYSNEENYEEIYFQKFLENDISSDDYYKYENSFKEMLSLLSSTGKTYIYFNFFTDIEKNYPFIKSDDISIDTDFIKCNNCKIVQVCEYKTLKQIFTLIAREIISSYLIFPSIKTVVVASGMHGYFIADAELDERLLKKLSNYIQIKRIENNN